MGGIGDIAKSDTRGDLAAVATPADLTTRWLAEEGREGLFVFTDQSRSLQVAADTAQGLYIAPASAPSGISGAWVRKFDGPINPRWFGVAPGNSGAANDAAWDAMWEILEDIVFNHIPSPAQGGLHPIRFPPGNYEFATTREIYSTALIEGAEAMGQSSGRATKLKFPAGQTGLRVHRSDTAGGTGGSVVTGRNAGDGTIIRNLAIFGGFVAGTTAEGEFHGIQARARCQIENIYIQDFQGDGIHINATSGSGTQQGNANTGRLIGGRIISCRNGLYINGADANIWTVIGLDCSSNRQWGFWDSSFLGNTYVGCHANGNGFAPAGTGFATSIVSHGGNRYYVIVGQEVGASTNAPSGTTANNTWWGYLSAGGTSSLIPAWASGTTYRVGGGYHNDNNSATTVFSGCYHESSQGLAQMEDNTLVIGGHLSLFMSPVSLGRALQVDGGYVLTNAGGFKVINGSTTASLGDQGQPTSALTMSHSTFAPNNWRLDVLSADVTVLQYANLAANRGWQVTNPATTQQFGTGANVPYAFNAPLLMVGNNLQNSRRLDNGTAAPTTGAHGAGEVYINRTPAVGGVAAWACRTAGTPGTWEPVGIVGAVRSAAQTDAAARTSVDGTNAVAAPTQAEFNALVAEFNKLRTDYEACRTVINGLLAKLRTANLMAS